MESCHDEQLDECDKNNNLDDYVEIEKQQVSDESEHSPLLNENDLLCDE